MSRAIKLILHKAVTHSTWHRSYSVTGSKNILNLRDRGLLQDIFPAACPKFSEVVSSNSAAIYAGFDPTADSLHVGNLLVVMAMLHCQRAKHKLVALIGGATAQLGDPTGRKHDRPILDESVVETNAKSIEKSLRRIFENHEKFWSATYKQELPSVTFVNNLEWYNKMNLIQFLSEIGRNFRLGTMLAKRSVQSRLTGPEGINFKEFTYQVFQAYDWLHLLQKYNCVLQLGGVDQMGNIHAGHELISRVENKAIYGMMVPLIISESGNKFGKSSAGEVVWLNSDKTSHFDFYQFFLRVKDSEVEKYLKLYTFLSLAEIKTIMDENQKQPEPRHAQRVLASSVTRLVHGEEGLNSAIRVTNAFYSKKPEVLMNLGENELQQVFKEAQTSKLQLQADTTVVDMALKAGCFLTEEDARRIIEAGGLYVNHRRVVNPDNLVVPGEHILPNNLSLIRHGKKNYYVVKWI